MPAPAWSEVRKWTPLASRSARVAARSSHTRPKWLRPGWARDRPRGRGRGGGRVAGVLDQLEDVVVTAEPDDGAFELEPRQHPAHVPHDVGTLHQVGRREH